MNFLRDLRVLMIIHIPSLLYPKQTQTMKYIHALGILCATVFTFSHAAARKPNFVYIMVDDAGYGDFSCFGQKHFKTPSVDRMATEGMKLTDFYAASTVCAPSRCSLMTGVHTGHALVRGNREVQPEGQAPLPASALTLPEVLGKVGYVSGMFGKWGLGSPGSEGDPMNQGFDRFYGYNCQRQAHTFYPDHLWSDRNKVTLDGKTYSHNLIAEETMKFIRANKDKPFFCYCPFTIPHAAMHAPEKEVAPWRKKFPQFENVIGRYRGPQVKNPVAAFAAMMTVLDRDVGRILDLLNELGIAEDTLVIFTSDNGPHKEGGHKPDFFDSNGPLRGYKRDLYEGGIRVPTLAWWPNTVKPSSTSSHIATGWDVLPTFCDLAGVKTPKNLDGVSFAPTLRGEKKKQAKRASVYWEFHEQGGKQAIRKGKWKAVRLNVRKQPDGPIELYDLSNDIGETNNLADKHPDLIKEMARLMTDSRTVNPTFRLFR
jgi:arylsulfatase A